MGPWTGTLAVGYLLFHNILALDHCLLLWFACAKHIKLQYGIKGLFGCLQDGVKQTEVDSYVAQQFRQADTDGDGQVTFEDFCEYYEAMSISRARLELRSTMGMEAEREQLCLNAALTNVLLAWHDYQKLQLAARLHVHPMIVTAIPILHIWRQNSSYSLCAAGLPC